MKKKLLILICLLSTTLLFPNTATKKTVDTIISKMNYSIIVSSEELTLTTDENGTFLLFLEDDFDNKVDIFMEVKKVTRDEVSEIISDADGARKVIELNDYIVLYAYQFIDEWYFVKTPKGNYYNVSYKLLSIPALLLDDF